MVVQNAPYTAQISMLEKYSIGECLDDHIVYIVQLKVIQISWRMGTILPSYVLAIQIIWLSKLTDFDRSLTG